MVLINFPFCPPSPKNRTLYNNGTLFNENGGTLFNDYLQLLVILLY